MNFLFYSPINVVSETVGVKLANAVFLPFCCHGETLDASLHAAPGDFSQEGLFNRANIQTLIQMRETWIKVEQSAMEY